MKIVWKWPVYGIVFTPRIAMFRLVYPKGWALCAGRHAKWIGGMPG